MNLSQEIFNWNLIFLKRVGFLDNQRRRAYFIITVPFAMWLSALYKLLTIINDFDEVVANLYVACGLSTLIVRLYVMVFKYEKVLCLFGKIEMWHRELQFENDVTTLKGLQEFIRISGRASKYAVSMLMCATIYIFAAQLITDRLLIEVSLPGVAIYQSPYYQIVTVLQIFWVLPIGTLTYGAYMCVMLISIYFSIFLMKDIQRKLENMQEMDELQALKCVKNCVRRHALIINFHHELEALFTFGNFVDVCLFFLIPCIIIYNSTMETDSASMFRDIQMVILAAISTFSTFWLADIFCCESVNISRAAYNSDWTSRGRDFRRYILLIIAISQKPLRLTAGGIKPLNMQTFMAILRSTYSLFTILQGTLNSN